MLKCSEILIKDFLNPFQVNALFLYPWKHKKARVYLIKKLEFFFMVTGGIEMEYWIEMYYRVVCKKSSEYVLFLAELLISKFCNFIGNPPIIKFFEGILKNCFWKLCPNVSEHLFWKLACFYSELLSYYNF